MAEYKLQNPVLLPDKRSNLLFPVALLWGLAVIFIIGYYVIDASLNNSGTKYYLLPWTFLTGAVILAPSVYLLLKRSSTRFTRLCLPRGRIFFRLSLSAG